MTWHIFTEDTAMRLYRCTPPQLGGTRRPDNCAGCGLVVTKERLYEAWRGDVPRPLNASLNVAVLS